MIITAVNENIKQKLVMQPEEQLSTRDFQSRKNFCQFNCKLSKIMKYQTINLSIH